MKTAKFLGNCQICEGDFKARKGVMVHHGYKRPGHGYIVGDCPGVAELPYEQSCEIIKGQLVSAKAALGHTSAYLAKLEAREVTHFTTYRHSHLRGEMIEKDYALGVSDVWQFHDAYRVLKQETHSRVKGIESMIARFEARIAAWELKPLRQVEA